MDSDFMNNLNSMMNNGNIPDDIKNLINNFKNNNSSSNDNSSSNPNNINDSSNANNINPDMIKNIMNMFNNSQNNNQTSDSSNNSNPSNIDIDMLLKMKSIMNKMNNNKNDPRSNLLLSLKPYLKESRKNKVEQYIQLFNMSKIIEAFNQTGGENSK